MNDVMEITGLSKRVYDIVAQYIYLRTEEKSGISWEHVKKRSKVDQSDVPAEYRDAREKVCQTAFLAMRACHAREDFVEYFIGTICSVPQFLPFREYQLVAQALLGEGGEWEQVKSLSMLTLSGLSEVEGTKWKPCNI